MKHKLDRESNKIIILDKDDNILKAMTTRLYLMEYNIDLFRVLQKNWAYKTKYHWTDQLDLDI